MPGRTPPSWRKLVIAGAIAAVASAVTGVMHGPPLAAQALDSIRWSVEAPPRAGQVQLTIDSRWGSSSRSTWSNTRNIAELQGLAPALLAGGRQPVRFALVKEAGRLDCAGDAAGGRGSGSCRFTPDPAFGSYLAAHGIGRPDEHQAFSLTMSGVGRELVEALEASRFAKPTVSQLTAMGIHGATAAYVREIGRLGLRLSAEDVIAFKIHGVEPQYIREMAAIGPGLRNLRASDLVALRIHGVEPRFVRDMAAIQPDFSGLTAGDLVSMSIHGVRPDLARTFVRLEGGHLRSEDLVSMAIHGVTPQYIEQLAAVGYRNLSAEDLVSMTIHGVSPSFVASLRRAGMGTLSADQLVRLRLSGFEPDAR